MKRLHGRKNWIVAQKKTLYRCKGVGTVIFEKRETHTPRLGRYDRSYKGRELSSYLMAAIVFFIDEYPISAMIFSKSMVKLRQSPGFAIP